mmetsp:Transcript_25840/g.73200  ORF Transcript_25840/g.73200 Transcript_25840/m.73200 type:complete len:246 (+) Transcript_25840:575-1312(+)
MRKHGSGMHFCCSLALSLFAVGAWLLGTPPTTMSSPSSTASSSASSSSSSSSSPTSSASISMFPSATARASGSEGEATGEEEPSSAPATPRVGWSSSPSCAVPLAGRAARVARPVSSPSPSFSASKMCAVTEPRCSRLLERATPGAYALEARRMGSASECLRVNAGSAGRPMASSSSSSASSQSPVSPGNRLSVFCRSSSGAWSSGAASSGSTRAPLSGASPRPIATRARTAALLLLPRPVRSRP